MRKKIAVKNKGLIELNCKINWN